MEKNIGMVVLAWDGRQFIGQKLPWNHGTTPARVGRFMPRARCSAVKQESWKWTWRPGLNVHEREERVVVRTRAFSAASPSMALTGGKATTINRAPGHLLKAPHVLPIRDRCIRRLAGESGLGASTMRGPIQRAVKVP
jgi:hypothetical protein